MITTTHSHRHWTDEGGHVIPTEQAAADLLLEVMQDPGLQTRYLRDVLPLVEVNQQTIHYCAEQAWKQSDAQPAPEGIVINFANKAI